MNFKRTFQHIVCFAIIAVMVSSLGVAQTRRHDVSLSYGLVTSDQITDILEDILTIIITFGTFSKRDIQFTGAPFFTYHYAPKGRFGVGFALGAYRSKGDLYLLDEQRGTFKETSYVGAAEIDYRWIMGRSFQLYSGLGAGATLKRGTYTVTGEPESEVTSRVRPTVHLNLLGFRVGGKVGFFAELGAGYKGVINLGLSAQF